MRSRLRFVPLTARSFIPRSVWHRLALVGSLMVGLAVWACGREPAFTPEVPELPPVPLGLDRDLVKVLDETPLTPEKVALGWQLFYDPRLSKDESISCASCHVGRAGFADPRKGSVGVGGAIGGRNAPPVINAAFNASQFWDGRSPSLEDQALGPIQNPIEMATTLEACEARLNEIPGYVQQFAEVFGTERISADLIAEAIASFERVVLSANAPWDRWEQQRDTAAVSDAARRGEELFRGNARCARCHTGSNYTDADADQFHNIGVGVSAPEPDLGRYNVSGQEADRSAFKTPTLRNVAETAPYMHDGSVATLGEVIAFYDRGGEANAWLDSEMRPLNLTEQEMQDLLAFLQALTGEVPEWTKRPPRLPPDEGGRTETR